METSGSNLIAGECSVADKGYKVLEESLYDADVGDPFYADKTELYLAEHPDTSFYIYYDPMNLEKESKKAPTLLGIFAELEPTIENILKFTNKYGLLEGPGLLPRPTRPNRPLLSINTWKILHHRLACAFLVWEWLTKRDIPKLSSFITWTHDAEGYSFKHKEPGIPSVVPVDDGYGFFRNTAGPLPSLSQIRKNGFPPDMASGRPNEESVISLSHLGKLRWVIVESPEDKSLVLRRSEIYTPGDVIGPAKASLARFINENISDASPRLMIGNSGDFLLQVSPGSLIDAIWMQFAQLVSGKMSIKRCKICGEWEDRTGQYARWERHDSCYEKMKKRNQREKSQRKEMADNGRDD